MRFFERPCMMFVFQISDFSANMETEHAVRSTKIHTQFHRDRPLDAGFIERLTIL